ncbi:beta-glucosidase (GH3) [Formosa agariphila KMM 3901]|uniref:Beta-xylosidase n=1 Tax=Formosa agariphila (strain DSM 15362 / KCTC 12365 / LMG 23005 / KMM 3901 / M-2Alg 35-1) TaxID=1347342 RepID=PLH24_FORAG|nr:beta-xylosidase [Formosa agariphila]T2KMH0.1 RecName: Full=Beta-xylosidase; AltName: Full=Glycosyl hydrolase 3 family protein P24; Short=P24_GH3; AltName: Full=Polysaccharide utilization locus H protein P24; Short=PUL H protein P24; Flags: Precursor [Formosa agariphila KMM 3901]CDF79925.1 beta-glucosidase (GH3) [Formosa agariphila KMM 3901]
MKKLWLMGLLLASFFTTVAQNNAQTKSNSDEEIDKKVATLISQMTLDEKIAEMTQDAPANERLGIPSMKYGEALHGLWLVLDYYGNTTVYPQAVAAASTWEPELIKKMASQTAREARALGVTHCYSPNLDVYAGDARYGRVEESYGEDPYLVSRMGVAFIEGLQGTGEEQFDENHVIATAKHFVGYPENRRGINGGFSDMSERRLREVYLPPFEAAVKEAGVGSVMPGHQDFNGVPCHMNTWLLKDILRDELGFDGFIVSDNNDVGRLETMHFIAENRTEAAILGLKAGVDMDLVIGKNVELATYHTNILKDTILKNPALMKYIDQATSRILTAKYKLGLFDAKPKKIDTETVETGTDEHREFALELAEKSIIMLKNDNNLLPLDVSKIKSLAVIGPNAHEERPKKGTYKLLGGYSGLPPYYVSVLDGLKKKVGEHVKINYAKGCDIDSFSKEGFPEAISAAKNSDAVVLVVGSSHKTCGEGGDRADLDLYGVQKELVEAIHKTGKPVIVVLINGRPLSINYIAENIPSILETWYGGMRAGDAVANVIFGDVNPGGKLTMSFPRDVGQVPVTYLERPDFIGSGKGQYRFSDKTPLFPFGFGLSYTTFKYGTPKLDNTSIAANGTTTVSVEVTNTGKVTGDEVVQMYVRDDYASVGRYLKMLKGFKRITLKPGETKTVSFKLGFDELNILNQDLKKVVEPGTFTISVGASSKADDLKTVSLTVK